jgi:hypothetical protein
MMRDTSSRARTAEKVAGVIAVIAALVVLNGAWVNQHTWQNISWRVAMATLLIAMALVVETKMFGLIRPRQRGEQEEVAVPEFLRAGEAMAASAGEGEGSRVGAETVGAGERR